MAVVPWSSFYGEVMPELPGCPAPMVDNALRNAAVRLLRTSKIQVEKLVAVDVVAGQGTYTLAAPSPDTTISGADEVRLGGVELDPITQDQAPSISSNWRTDSGTPRAYLQPTPLSLILVPVPATDLAGGLEVWAAVEPSATASGVEAWVFERFREEIAAGAKARLMAQPKKDWSDPNMAAYYQGLFDDGQARANAIKSKGVAAGRGRVRSYPR